MSTEETRSENAPGSPEARPGCQAEDQGGHPCCAWQATHFVPASITGHGDRFYCDDHATDDGNRFYRADQMIRLPTVEGPVACSHPATYDTLPSFCTKCGAIEGTPEWAERQRLARAAADAKLVGHDDSQAAMMGRGDSERELRDPRPASAKVDEEEVDLSDLAMRTTVEDFATCKMKYERNAVEAREMAREILRLRAVLPTCSRGPKACDEEIARLTAELTALRSASAPSSALVDAARAVVRGRVPAVSAELEGSTWKHSRISDSLTDRLRAAIDALPEEPRSSDASPKDARDDAEEARAALLTVAQALGMSYAPDTGPDAPAPTDAIVEYVRELKNDVVSYREALENALIQELTSTQQEGEHTLTLSDGFMCCGCEESDTEEPRPPPAPAREEVVHVTGCPLLR